MAKIMHMLWTFGKLLKWTLWKYHSLYLKVDVLLLACVFETFRKESINYFELDPVHNLCTPGYSWDAMLRLADINLKPISDTKSIYSLKAW